MRILKITLLSITYVSISLCYGSRFFTKRTQQKPKDALDNHNVQRAQSLKKNGEVIKENFLRSHEVAKTSLAEAKNAKTSYHIRNSEENLKPMLLKTVEMAHKLQNASRVLQQNHDMNHSKNDIIKFEETLTEARNFFFGGKNNSLNFPQNSKNVLIGALPLSKSSNIALNSKTSLLRQEIVALTFAKVLNKTSQFREPIKQLNNQAIDQRIQNLQQTITTIKNIPGFKELSQSSQSFSKYLAKTKSLISKIDPVNILLVSSISALLVLLVFTIDNLAEDIY